MKVAINTCFGGFSLSEEADTRLKELGWVGEWSRNIARDHPLLIQVIEELGPKANGSYAELSIVEIPDDVEWQIEEYDGNEHVSECHRTWRQITLKPSIQTPRTSVQESWLWKGKAMKHSKERKALAFLLKKCRNMAKEMDKAPSEDEYTNGYQRGHFEGCLYPVDQYKIHFLKK